MILWFSANSGAGKTTFAKKLIKNDDKTIWLDGDRMRDSINQGLGLSKEDRWENNLRIARLAAELAYQGFNVVVSVIAPYKELRKQIKAICDPVFIYIDGEGREKKGEKYPYELPTEELLNFKISI